MRKGKTMKTTSTDRIEKQIDLKATPERVWKALADHKEFSAWFGVNMKTPFVAGKLTEGKMTVPGYEHVALEIFIKEMTPPHRFSYTWHPYAIDPKNDYSDEPQTLVEFTLEKIEGGTRLTVVESGFDALPAHRRDEAFRMNDGGWKHQMGNIEKHIAAHA